MAWNTHFTNNYKSEPETAFNWTKLFTLDGCDLNCQHFFEKTDISRYIFEVMEVCAEKIY